eukprot:gene7267-379_t
MGNQGESSSGGEPMEKLLKDFQAGMQGETPPSQDPMAELLSIVQEGMPGDSSSGETMNELMRVLRAGNQEELSNEQLAAEFLQAYKTMQQAKMMKEEPMEELLKRAKALPMMCTPNTPGFTPEIWAVSYTAISNTGWMITMAIEHMYTQHDEMMMNGKGRTAMNEKPCKEAVVRNLLDAMLNPVRPGFTGPPHRPLQLLIAYRLRKSFAYIKEHMHKIGVACQLEEEAEALKSARDHGTSTRYCSKECQAAHWASGHKKKCKTMQQKQ